MATPLINDFLFTNTHSYVITLVPLVRCLSTDLAAAGSVISRTPYSRGRRRMAMLCAAV